MKYTILEERESTKSNISYITYDVLTEEDIGRPRTDITIITMADMCSLYFPYSLRFKSIKALVTVSNMLNWKYLFINE